MKNKFVFVIVVIAAMVLAACGGLPGIGSQSGGSGAQNGGTISGPLDPALAKDNATQNVINHMYEGLVGMSNGEAVLTLAANATVSADGLDYIFSLRPGVTFHDGTPFDADAVLSNFNRWYDPKSPLRGTGTYDAWVASFGGFKGQTTPDGKPMSEFDGIEKVNEQTVLVHLNRPDADFLTKLASPSFAIVSPAALQAAGFGTQSGKDGGTGAYKISAWDGSKLTLAPYTGYWNTVAVPSQNLDVTVSQ